MVKNEIVLIGGGGHCKACIDVIEMKGTFKIVGIVDVKEKLGKKVLRYKVIGCDDDLPKLIKRYRHFFITIGQLKDAEKRMEIYACLKSLGANFPVIISPLAYVSRYASLGDGTIVMHRAVVNAGTTIGSNCIINTGSIIEHDAHIGDHCHVSTGAVINGGVVVGNGTFFGSNSMAREYIKIGDGSIIAAGLNVMTDIDPGAVIRNPWII